MGKKKYFNHSWSDVMNAPDDVFETLADHWTVEELIEAKTQDYIIPSTVTCILRVHNTKTQKITEYTYQKINAAKKRLEDELYKDDPIEITVLSEDHYYVVCNYMPHDHTEED